jgi:hypothetical protein
MSLPTPVRAPNRCRLHSMSAFEGNPNDICSDRVLLSLTQNGPIPRRGQKSAGSMPVFSIGPKCGVMSRCGIRQMPHGQNQGGRRNGGWRTKMLMSEAPSKKTKSIVSRNHYLGAADDLSGRSIAKAQAGGASLWA